MGLRTWVKKRLFGKAETVEMPGLRTDGVVGKYTLKPSPWDAAMIPIVDPMLLSNPIDEVKAFLSQENHGQALVLVERLIQSGDHLAEAWELKSVILMKKVTRQERLISQADILAAKITTNDLASSTYKTGLQHIFQGEFAEAVQSFKKVNEYQPENLEARLNTGAFSQLLGQHKEALIAYDKVLEYNSNYCLAWYNRGSILLALNRIEESIESFDKAIECKLDDHGSWYQRSVAAKNSSTQIPFDNLLVFNHSPASLHLKHDELIQRGYLGQIASLSVGLIYCPIDTHPLGYSYLQRRLGDAYKEYADSQQSSDYFWNKALTAYKISLSAHPKNEHVEERLLTLQSLIRICLILNEISVARDYQIQGISLYEVLRAKAPDKRAFEFEFDALRLLEIDIIIGENKYLRALEQSEFYKNRALTWLLDHPDTFLKKTEMKRTRKSSAPHLLISGIKLNTSEQNQVDRAFEVSSFNGDLGGSIVYWHQSTDRITTFILTNDNPEPIVLDCDRQQQHKQFTKWKEDWDKDYDDYRSKKSATQLDHPWRQQMSDRLTQLAAILEIDAIERHLKNTKTLILIPHRDLHRYPIHTLFKNHPTTHVPSLQSIVRASHPAPSSDRPSLLLINDPDRSSRLENHTPMPFAQIESAITQNIIDPNATHINHTNATHNAIIQQLTQQNHHYFHFIGHAEHNFQKPEHSALDLCDRPLTAKTIANLNLHHLHLVTLSSCETSIVSSTNHTEYLGLTSAFLCAGTQTILSTLWQVEEIASAWFMIHFHQLIKIGLSPAIALHHTQTWMQTVTWREFTHWLEELRQLPGLPSFPIDRLESRIENILQNGDTINLNEPTEYCDPIHWAAFILTGQG